MERLAVDNLPDGTLEKLRKKAIKLDFRNLNGTANISAYLRYLINEQVKNAKSS